MSIVDQLVKYEQRKIRTRALAYVNADRRKHDLPDLTGSERSAVAAFYLQAHPGAVAPTPQPEPAPAPTLYADTFADLKHWYALGSPYPVESNYSRVTVVDPKAEGLPAVTGGAAKFEHTAADLQAGRYHDKALYIPHPPTDPDAAWTKVGLPVAECDHLTFSTSVLFPSGYQVGRAWVNVLQTKNQQITSGKFGYQNPQWWVNVANADGWISGVSGPVLFLSHNNNRWGYTPKVVPVRFDTWTRLELEVAKDQFVELRIDGQVVERSTPSTYGCPVGPQAGDTEYVPGVGNYPGDAAGAVPSRLYHADFQIA